MLDVIRYIFLGSVHLAIISFEFLDYIEQALIGLLIIFFIGMAVWDRKFIKIYLDIGKTFFKMVFSPFGVILLITMASYYCFTIFAFEDSINILIIIITLALFCKDLFEFMNNSILDKNKKTIVSIMEISESVFILFFYRLLYVVELGNYSELNKVIYSLIFVPIIATIIIIMKILTTVEVITVRYSRVEKLDDIEYLKLFLIVLIRERSINNTNKIMNDFFRNNRQLLYYEARERILEYESAKIKNKEKNVQFSEGREKINFNIKSIIFIIWIINFLSIIYSIIMKRFFDTNFDIGYYLSLAILSIYFIADMMKIYKIECQYDFVIYFVISLVECIILLVYYIQIQNGRLSNMLFLVVVYSIIAILFRRTKTMRFLDMPFLSEKNFFGLHIKEVNKK